MRIDFLKTEGEPTAGADAPPEKVTAVGSVGWDGSKAVLIGAADEATGRSIMGLFAPTPLVADDPSLRQTGSGPCVIQPGSLLWFREAAITRASRLGLSTRVVADPAAGEGFDPAAQYADFDVVISRIQAGA